MVDMSALEVTSSDSLVDRILEQGQRLRNAMVQTILNNDPFNKELLRNGGTRYPELATSDGSGGDDGASGGVGKQRDSTRDEWNIHKYLDGEEMGACEEMRALETLRSMSPLSLIQSTTCLKHSDHTNRTTKSCDICQTYERSMCPNNTGVGNKNSAAAPTAMSNVEMPKGKLTDSTSNRHDALRYVDSLKVHVYSLRLNSAGRKKVSTCESAYKPHLLPGNCTYFVEYALPDVLLKPVARSRAKVNTGLKPAKSVRFCSRKVHNDAVSFRQEALHQITNVRTLDPRTVTAIEFRVSFRCVKQRTAQELGLARVSLAALVSDRYLSSDQELVVCGEHAPLVLATLKVTLQLGCDRLYFGREFIDAISCSKENNNSKLSDSDSLYKQSETEQQQQQQQQPSQRNKHPALTADKQQLSKANAALPTYERSASNIPTRHDSRSISADGDNEDNKHLLYTLIFISEVRVAAAATQPLDSYVVCHGLTADDLCTSKTICNSFSPVFNLYQVIPVLWNGELVNRLRDNYLLVELWQKKPGNVDTLVGITKLPLHQLYVAYRNPVIVKHLARNQYPVIGVDWWETVTEPVSNRDCGQIRALIALGTQTQVETLESARKLKQRTAASAYPYTGQLATAHEHNRHHQQQQQQQHSTTDRQPKQASGRTHRSGRYDHSTTTSGVDGEVNRYRTTRRLLSEPDFHFRPNRYTEYGTTEGKLQAEQPADWKAEFNRRFPLETSRQQHVLQKELNTTRSAAVHMTTPPPPPPPPATRTICVSDKSVQQPDVEIAARLATAVAADSHKVDASTQSEPQSTTTMDAERTDSKDAPATNPPYAQRDFFHSFLEQLISTRDLNQRNRHVENSTNTEQAYVITAPAAPATSATTHMPNASVTNPLYVNTASLPEAAAATAANANLSVRNTSDLLDSLQKALSGGGRAVEKPAADTEGTADTFKVHIVIDNALHLPSRKKCRSKRNRTTRSVAPAPAKTSEEILPSTYVTFKCDPEADECVSTTVVARSTSPRWDYRCDTRLPADLLLNNQKRLIFKVWRKATGPSLQPNFDTDVVLGFAALDLTVLLSGLPTVQGWFNIVDFSSKCNGQIKIHVTPLENLSRFNGHKRTYVPEQVVPHEPALLPVALDRGQTPPEDGGVPADVLSRALKRKFTELDEITQRLRQRLSAVTNDDSDGSLDELFMDEFERDLNTECPELEQAPQQQLLLPDLQSSGSEVSEQSCAHNSQLITLDAHLADGKLKIDTLLEKLTLLTGESDKRCGQGDGRLFSSRYVSGCSMNQDVEAAPVLQQIGLQAADNLDPDLIFNPLLFQQMFAGSVESTPRLQDSLEGTARVHQVTTTTTTTLQSLLRDSVSTSNSTSSSGGSILASVRNSKRDLPDGAGNSSVDSLL